MIVRLVLALPRILQASAALAVVLFAFLVWNAPPLFAPPPMAW